MSRIGTRALTMAALTLVVALGSPPAAPADVCPNAGLRAQNNSSELPDCRAYEMVTPAYTEGFTIGSPQAFSDDGDVFAYMSLGNFAGNPTGSVNQYLATRSPAGWATTALNPPNATYDAQIGAGAEARSRDLQSTLWLQRRRVSPLDDNWSFYLRGPDGIFSRVGQDLVPGLASNNVLYARGTSADLSHVVFAHLPGVGTQAIAALWEFVGIGNGGPPRPVSVNNDGQQTEGQACFQSMSDDGRVIVFSSGCNGTAVPRLWARVGGSATVAVSASQCSRAPADSGGVCNDVASADYAGAATDGSRVFFTTTQQLVDGDTDTTNDVYACDIPAGAPAPVGAANPCSSLIEVSGAATGADVENVVATSDDGSRVYFVARGVLADNLGTDDAAPISGENNLYLWTEDAAHPGGQTRFVAPLRFVDPLQAGDLDRAQITPDGRYLIFSTASQLVTVGAGADDDNARDVYRYDSLTGALVRLSVSVSGGGGNSPGFDASATSAARPDRRSAYQVTADGSMVVFTTDEALSPRDVDGGPDVYAWHDGHVSLISDGLGGGTNPWITPSGRDIFFSSDQPLTPADGDAITDVYDARVDGGFDFARTPPCSGDDCQGGQSTAPSLERPAPVVPAGVGGATAAPVLSLRAVSAAQLKRLAETGKVTLTVTSNAAGTVSVKATARIAGKSATVASARRTMARPGKVTVTMALSKAARRQLAARGKLSVKVAVGHSKVALERTVTLRLVHAKAKKKRSAVRSHAAQVRADGVRS